MTDIMTKPKLLKKNVKFKEWQVDIIQSTYAYDPVNAIFIIDTETGEPIATCSTNPTNLAALTANTVAIKDWSENEGMSAFLIKEEIISAEPVSMCVCGFEVADIYTLLPIEEITQ